MNLFKYLFVMCLFIASVFVWKQYEPGSFHVIFGIGPKKVEIKDTVVGGIRGPVIISGVSGLETESGLTEFLKVLKK